MSTTPGPVTSDLPPEPPFELGNVATELYDATAPMTFADQALGFPWAKYLASLGLEIEDEAVLTGGDGDYEPWTAMADPARCPTSWLGVLAQWAGVRNRSSYDETDLRQTIGPHAPGLWRGTKAAMIAAVQRYTDDPIFFQERAGGDPYALSIFTYDYGGGIEYRELAAKGAYADVKSEYATYAVMRPESATIDPRVRAALIATKPAGLILDYEARIGQNYRQVGALGNYTTVEARYPSYDTMLHNTLGA